MTTRGPQDVTAYGGTGLEERWNTAHETADRVRAALLAIGIPEAELDLLTARAGISARARVILPPLSLESAELLLRALGPALGPSFVGRRDAAPTPPGRTA
jgi:hypothetical protein